MFTEHWLKGHYLKLIHVDQYKLVSYFSRKNYSHGGSSIYVKKKASVLKIYTVIKVLVWRRILKCLTELVDYGYIIVCIYRSPYSNCWIFLKNLNY